MSNTVYANITPTPPLTVSRFIPPSRSLPATWESASLEADRARSPRAWANLQALTFLNLLGQAKAISTVSGGSWLGVPFEFLPFPAAPPIARFSASMWPIPAALTLAQLGTLPAGNAGIPITADWFSPEMLALSAFVLWAALDVPANMLLANANRFEHPLDNNCFQTDAALAPANMFSYNQASLQAITSANPSLASEPTYLYADAVGTGRIQRPFLICNMGMFMSESGTIFQPLAPVQVTPFMTGIMGQPVGKDANGLNPGGGGVTSFAFNSIFVSRQRQCGYVESNAAMVARR